MQIHLTPERELTLAQIAAHEGTSLHTLMKAAAMRLLNDEAGLPAAVQEGVAEGNSSELVSLEDVRANVGRVLRS
jgi:predicted transcriptional regulator